MKRELVFKQHPDYPRNYIPFLNGIELPFVAGVVIESPFSELTTVSVSFVVEENENASVRIEKFDPELIKKVEG